MELPPIPESILETAAPANRAPGLERREPSVKKVHRREQRQRQSESQDEDTATTENEEQDRHTFDTRA